MIDWDSCVLWLDSRYFSESYWWDRSKYANDGIVHEAVWKEDSFYFGGNDYIRIKNNSIFNFNNKIAIEVIFNPSLNTDFSWAISKDFGNSNLCFLLGLTGSGKLRFITRNLGGNVYSLNPVTYNKETHVLTYDDGNNIKIYVNGKFINSNSISGNWINNNADILIGARISDDPTQFYLGKIKLIRIYKDIPSDDEIKILAKSAEV